MKRAAALTVVVVLLAGLGPPARGYVINHTIGAAGGCPQPQRFNTTAGGIVDRRWSTSLHPNILTAASDTTAREEEIEQTILRAFAVWTGVAGTTLTPSSLGSLESTPTQAACRLDDGLNTLCFNQSSDGFASGVLAFTVVVTSDIVGEQPFPHSPPSEFVGEILDADVLLRPPDSENRRFATPAALSAGVFDLETVLAHELGHLFGFSHSGVARAMMFPFAPAPGTFLGDRPTEQRPDAPLGDDDRAGLRALYPDPNTAADFGSITGFLLPANPIALAGLPEPSPGRPVTGIFGGHVVVVDADTGAVAAAAIGGWSCDAGDLPTRFDGFYRVEGLPLGRRYKVYAEPLVGPTRPGNYLLFNPAAEMLCRSDTNNACTLPAANTGFSAQVRP